MVVRVRVWAGGAQELEEEEAAAAGLSSGYTPGRRLLSNHSTVPHYVLLVCC